jgi:hypothetical protein
MNAIVFDFADEEYVSGAECATEFGSTQNASASEKLSLVKRFERFLKNKAVRVHDWYYPFAISLVQAAGGDPWVKCG